LESDEPQTPIAALEALLAGEGALPALHALDDGPGSEEAFRLLEKLLAGLRSYRVGGAPLVFSLEELSADALLRLAETLGQGEVSLTVTGSHVFRIRETSLAGLWRVQDVQGEEVRGDFLEIADVPSVVRAANTEGTCSDLSINAAPVGSMNALPVLSEVRHRMTAWRPGEPNHVISFTLLPMNEVDMRVLQGQLGRGPVRAETLGYSRCMVELTGHRNVWSVQFFNNGGKIVLDTLEVGDVPVALTAAAEDFEDSALRLAELLGGP
jgi:hydrogenase-1 operon protein HyaF